MQGHIYNFICVYPLSMFYTILLYVCIYAAYCFVATHCIRNDLCPLVRSCAGLLPILEPPLGEYASGNEWSIKVWMSVYVTIRCFWMLFFVACALFGIPDKTDWDFIMSTHKCWQRETVHAKMPNHRRARAQSIQRTCLSTRSVSKGSDQAEPSKQRLQRQ